MKKDKLTLEDLERHLGYTFKNKGFLKEALTHSSYANEFPNDSLKSNETLEFLGDAVIDLVTCHLLIEKFPELDEGELSKIKSKVVGTISFANIARELELGDHIVLGKGEETSGGREKESILAGAYEAVVAAIYLDAGFNTIFHVIKEHLLNTIDGIFVEGFFRDHKTELQELSQRLFKSTPVYNVIGEEGPGHEKIFEIEVVVGNKICGRGVARSKKEAEQKAAAEAYKELSNDARARGEG